MSISPQQTPTLSLQKHLLKTHNQATHNPLLKGEFVEIGTNGLIQVEPEVVKFDGFYLKKEHRKRILIRNVSKHVKRVHVLGTNTSPFKIENQSKGSIAAGMSQILTLVFTPQEYKYHYDNIKIYAEAENILVPIYAYPVMNKQLAQQIPRFIDLGTKECGSSVVRAFTITNNIPVTFEFEIEVTKPHPEINIKPLYGEIEGDSSANIEIAYYPKEPKTAIAEFLFKLSQYEFQPLFTRISASAIPPIPQATLRTKMSQSLRSKQAMAAPTPKGEPIISISKKGNTKTLLTTKPSIRTPSAAIRLSKIQLNQKSLPPKKVYPKTKYAVKQELTIAGGVSPNFLIYEENFISEFRKLEELEREKEIKFFQCSGDDELTHQEIEDIQKEQKESEKFEMEHRMEKDRNRQDFEFGMNAIVDCGFQTSVEPKWDVYANDQFSLRHMHLTRFQKAANIVLTRIRAGKRLSKLKNKISEQNVKNKEDCKQMVADDWKQALTSNKQDTAYIDFTFTLENIKIQLETIAIEHDVKMESFKEKVEAEIETSFDDFKTYQPIEPLDFQIHSYIPFQIPPASNYIPIEDEKPVRPGAEDEYTFTGSRGDPDLSVKGSKLPFLVEMPASFLKQMQYPGTNLVLPHPSLRDYIKYELFSEVDVDFQLYPRERERKPIMDELALNNTLRGYKGTLIQLPGYDSIMSIGVLCSRISEFWRPRLDLPESIALGNLGADLPVIIEKSKIVDMFTESDSEAQNQFEMKVPNSDDLLSEIEADDKTLQEINKTHSLKIISQAQQNNKLLNHNIKIQRKAWASKIPTAMEDYNAYIHNPQNKLYLL